MRKRCDDFGVDYRTANVSYTMTEESACLYARFVSAEEDAAVLTAYMDGEEFTVEGEWLVSLAGDEIASYTVPTMRMTGLPKGLTFNAKTLEISGTPTVPGIYEVTVTLSNASIKNKTEKFTIRVPNLDGGCVMGLGDKDTPMNYQVGITSECSSLIVLSEAGYTLKVSGLPAGLKFDSKTGEIVGTPTKAGTYTVTFTASQGRDVRVSTRTIVVEALPVRLIGTYNGFVRGSSGAGNRGTFTLTSTEAGKITAKVIDAKGTYTFTGAWNCGSEGTRYSAMMVSAKGEVLEVEVDVGAAWNDASCRGTFSKLDAGVMSVVGTIEARKNPLADRWYLKAVSDGEGWSFSFVETANEADLTVLAKGDGTLTIAGKIGSYLVSASSMLLFNQMAMGEGVFTAEFVTFVSVNKVKMALAITCNLWIDRRGGNCAGSAKLVE